MLIIVAILAIGALSAQQNAEAQILWGYHTVNGQPVANKYVEFTFIGANQVKLKTKAFTDSNGYYDFTYNGATYNSTSYPQIKASCPDRDDESVTVDHTGAQYIQIDLHFWDIGISDPNKPGNN